MDLRELECKDLNMIQLLQFKPKNIVTSIKLCAFDGSNSNNSIVWNGET